MHEGMRLYLAGVCDVLDTWADHLGLNRQSESMSKRHKARHDSGGGGGGGGGGNTVVVGAAPAPAPTAPQ
jgi:hypothetical protein